MFPQAVSQNWLPHFWPTSLHIRTRRWTKCLDRGHNNRLIGSWILTANTLVIGPIALPSLQDWKYAVQFCPHYLLKVFFFPRRNSTDSDLIAKDKVGLNNLFPNSFSTPYYFWSENPRVYRSLSKLWFLKYIIKGILYEFTLLSIFLFVFF